MMVGETKVLETKRLATDNGNSSQPTKILRIDLNSSMGISVRGEDKNGWDDNDTNEDQHERLCANSSHNIQGYDQVIEKKDRKHLQQLATKFHSMKKLN